MLQVILGLVIIQKAEILTIPSYLHPDPAHRYVWLGQSKKKKKKPKPTQFCKVIILQLKINLKLKKIVIILQLKIFKR